MNIQKMITFVTLAETLNYTETAELLYTTQGNVSKQILSLEKELDTQLFKRSQAHRNVQLTNAGKIAVSYAKNIINTYDDLKYVLEQIKDTQNSRLILHGIPTMASYRVPNLLKEFKALYPEIVVTIEEEESDSLFRSLDHGHCDVIFARIFQLDLVKYEKVLLATDHFVAVLSNNHPLAKRKKIQLAELRDEVFLQLGKSTQLYEVFVALCQAAGFSPRIGYHGQRTDLILDFVANEMGIAVLMQKTLKNLQERNLTAVPIDFEEESEISFVRRSDHHSLAVKLFWDFVKAQTNSQATRF